MHPSNPYALKRPDFAALAKRSPDLAPFLITAGAEQSIDFTNPAALRTLTSALLRADFDLDVELRDDRLCPTIANRLDYILTCLDLPSPHPLRVLDVGTGHVAIYPLLLHRLRPEAAVCGSEIDEVSLEHARGVLEKNGIRPVPVFDAAESVSGQAEAVQGESTPHSDKPETEAGSATPGGITLLPACPDGSLLSHPIYPLRFTLCNPPFFASEEEALESRSTKPVGTSAPTCAPNEEVTRGGEVAFVSRLIDESAGKDCTWFTSLVGKYASLAPLVRKAKESGNYALVRLQQARTVRWVLVWSHDHYRLPDEMTRPHYLDPSTSYARLLPLPNTFVVESALSEEELRAAVDRVLREVGLVEKQGDTDTAANEAVALAPRTNTWSRAARRAAAAAAAASETPADEPAEPLFRATLSIEAATSAGPTSEAAGPADTGAATTDHAPADAPPADAPPANAPSADAPPAVPADTRPRSRLVLRWTWGPDRLIVDAFWKFLVSKALPPKRPREGAEEGEAEGRAQWGRGRGGGRGGRGGRGGHGGRTRGNARGGRGRGFAAPAQDAGWGGR